MTTRRIATVCAAAATAVTSLTLTATTIASAAPTGAGAGARPGATVPHLRAVPILNGMKLKHTYIPAGSTTPRTEPLTLPDDITAMGGDLFTAFQNGVGPQGQPSTDGNTDSTVVEFTPGGHVVQQWDIQGKCDGVAADPGANMLVATVNEDAGSSIYTISPTAATSAQVQHYQYNEPLPHFGGTDAVSVLDGKVIVSASAPGTTGQPAPQPTYPAAYAVSFDSSAHVATVSPLFYDEARATVANVGPGGGKVVRLALTDPDSNAVVPASAPRFAGDFELTSQAEQEQIFAQPSAGTAAPHLSVLRLSRAVDDTAWATSSAGALFGSNTSGDTIDAITGRYPANGIFVAVTPCDAGNAPPTCPGPGFPPNYLGMLNPFTGHVTRVPLSGATFEPQGLLFTGPGSTSGH